MKGIDCCGQCADYSYKLHKCTRGFSQGVASDSFYTDCDLPEAETVKHGRWEINCDGYYPYCSNCKNEPQGREMTLYCPNCGARMDGDSDA